MIRRNYTHGLAPSRNRRLAWTCLFIFALAVAGAVFIATARKPAAAAAGQRAAPAAPLLSTVAPSLSSTPAVRQVYPYSVVPGGVVSRAELASVVKSDAVVAAHYATFNMEAARIVRVVKPRAVYVSYRKGDKIYWTANKVILPAGETLLSDGVNEARTRCANRISDVFQLPVAADEPSLELLNASADLLDEGLESTGASNAVGPHGATTAAINMSTENQGGMPTDSAGRHSNNLTAGGASLSPSANDLEVPRNAAESASSDPLPSDAGTPEGSGTSPAAGNNTGEAATSTTNPIGKDEPAGVGDPDSEQPTPPVFIVPEGTLEPGVDPVKPAPFGPEPAIPWPPGPLPTVAAQDAEQVGTVPEPTTLSLMVCALGVLGALRRRRQQNATEIQASHSSAPCPATRALAKQAVSK